jgi:hypothetical protein
MSGRLPENFAAIALYYSWHGRASSREWHYPSTANPGIIGERVAVERIRHLGGSHLFAIDLP